jgi:hypothetical protein
MENHNCKNNTTYGFFKFNGRIIIIMNFDEHESLLAADFEFQQEWIQAE